MFVSLLPRNVDVVLQMHLWRYATTRFPANIERSSLEDVYAFVLWRYVAVQIWRVKELFVPGIVSSTINRTFCGVVALLTFLLV